MTDYMKRTIVKEEVPSRILGESRPVKVYLPPGYNDMLSYPVLYCQDGNDFFTMGRIATIANKLILEENMQPMIIVGVSVERRKRTSEYSPVGELNAFYKQFFATELLPYIESNFPIRRQPEERVLAGDSLGGTVSLHLAMDYPDLFHNLLSLSGAFLLPTIEGIRMAADMPRLKAWMIVGLQETSVETHMGTFDFVYWNREAKEALERKKVRVTYAELRGEHTWGLWQQVLPNGLRHFFPATGL
jgi:enterochelin esterase-like enzyme